MNSIKDIVIGGTYSDNGKDSFSTQYKSVTVTEVTANTVRFRDNGGYYSWMAFDKFQKRMTLKS